MVHLAPGKSKTLVLDERKQIGHVWSTATLLLDECVCAGVCGCIKGTMCVLLCAYHLMSVKEFPYACTAAHVWFLSIFLAICTEERFTYQIFLRLRSIRAIRKAGIFIRSTSIKRRKAWCWLRLPSTCSANRPRRGGGEEKSLFPQWLETPSKSMWLTCLFTVSSGWGRGGECFDFHRMARRWSDSFAEHVNRSLSQESTAVGDGTKTTWWR